MEMSGLLQASPYIPSAIELRGSSSCQVSLCSLRNWSKGGRKSANLSTCRLLPRRRKGYEYKTNKHMINRLGYYPITITSCRMENQDFGEGRMVDEGMIVLRLRMKELEILEKGQDVNVPSNWFNWEKKHYMHYQSGVYEAIGYLQHLLMSCRPSLALGIIAFATISVMFSSGLLMLHTIEMLQGTMP